MLAIQAKKKRKNPKGRKSGNFGKDSEQNAPASVAATPGSGNNGSQGVANNPANNGQSRETRSAQPR